MRLRARAAENARRPSEHQEVRVRQLKAGLSKHAGPAVLIASGSHKGWDVAIDEAKPRQWFAEVRGPSFYFHFQIPRLEVVHEWLRFINGGPRQGRSRSTSASELIVGTFLGEKVAIVRDSEFSDRYFLLVVGTDGSLPSCLRIPVAGEDLVALREALRQVKAGLSG